MSIQWKVVSLITLTHSCLSNCFYCGNLEIDTEAGVQGHEHDGAAAANGGSKFGYRGKALAVL
eukprot:scaffold10634_cov105-Skeletonema_menzelii.AAC.1